MIDSTKLKKWTFSAAALGAVLYGCKPAAYEIIKPKKSHGDRTSDSATPGPTVIGDGSSDGTASSQGIPPTARIEVMWDGASVTKVRVNREVLIHPSADTLDPDDIGKSQCANPGIVEASFDIASVAKPQKQRHNTCDSLGVPYTFSAAGRYKLEMQVTSNEGETAKASMILEVLDESAPLTNDGGFTIQAIPMLADVGANVDFYGFCQIKGAHTIAWDFGDKATGTGITTKHSYAAPGSYTVLAVCTETATKRELTAELTVVVLKGAPSYPGAPTGPILTDGTDTNPQTPPAPECPTCLPGQTPGQKRPGQTSQSTLRFY
ncbi:hypothetical protein E3A20_00210 [Planctomyces bekefii]|uniref:PKD domain-containing protein n=1 Tax=Planctomyces bekefii TaxID=1653850 RepID=A0A5C6MEA6_9PLAN|nr:hypothetical protein E3A20_00210 [Planctomyces bekefii]